MFTDPYVEASQGQHVCLGEAVEMDDGSFAILQGITRLSSGDQICEFRRLLAGLEVESYSKHRLSNLNKSLHYLWETDIRFIKPPQAIHGVIKISFTEVCFGYK